MSHGQNSVYRGYGILIQGLPGGIEAVLAVAPVWNSGKDRPAAASMQDGLPLSQQARPSLGSKRILDCM